MRMFVRMIFLLSIFLSLRVPCYAQEIVVVMPFIDPSQYQGSSDNVTDMFARELVKAGGYRVYHPQVVRKYLSSHRDQNENPGSCSEAIETAEIFGARYVISGIITKYDGFPPFSLDISVEMFDAASGERLSADSISRAGPSLRQRFASFTKKQTMDQYVREACAQLIARSFTKKSVIK